MVKLMSFVIETFGFTSNPHEVIVKEISNNISKVFFIFINFLIIHSTLLYKVANI